jgi:hypothetical protein
MGGAFEGDDGCISQKPPVNGAGAIRANLGTGRAEACQDGSENQTAAANHRNTA